MPLPNEINQNTIQNALISIGPIKATLYDTLSTIIEPRVVGFYDPIGGGTELANAVISFLSIKRAIWYRPCQLVKNADQ